MARIILDDGEKVRIVQSLLTMHAADFQMVAYSAILAEFEKALQVLVDEAIDDPQGFASDHDNGYEPENLLDKLYDTRHEAEQIADVAGKFLNFEFGAIESAARPGKFIIVERSECEDE